MIKKPIFKLETHFCEMSNLYSKFKYNIKCWALTFLAMIKTVVKFSETLNLRVSISYKMSVGINCTF